MSEYWEKYAKEMNEDLATDSIREDIQLSLTDKQLKELTLMALSTGFESPAGLIQSFIGDLTKCHHNGSDERGLAEEWFERAHGIYLETHAYFRHFLFKNNYNEDHMVDLLDDEEHFDEVYEDYIDDYSYRNSNMHFDSKEECIEILKSLASHRLEEILSRNKELYDMVKQYGNSIKLDAGQDKGTFEFTLHENGLVLDITIELFSLCDYIPFTSIHDPIVTDEVFKFKYIGLECSIPKKQK